MIFSFQPNYKYFQLFISFRLLQMHTDTEDTTERVKEVKAEVIPLVWVIYRLLLIV